MKEIPLSQGKVALVDDCDFEVVSQYKWCAWQERTGIWYATRMTSRKEGPQKQVSMHRQLLGFPAGMEIDHRNHNGLDNRRENLRTCTRTQNLANNRRHRDQLFYKGIHQSRSGKWIALIQVNRHRKSLGRFRSPEEAALAYDREAYAAWGEFAYLNFPNELRKDGDAVPEPSQLTLAV